MTKAYEKDRHWPLVADSDDFHKGRAGRVKRNAVFFPDLQTDWTMEITPTEAGKFIADMQKYGGMP